MSGILHLRIVLLFSESYHFKDFKISGTKKPFLHVTLGSVVSIFLPFIGRTNGSRPENIQYVLNLFKK